MNISFTNCDVLYFLSLSPFKLKVHSLIINDIKCIHNSIILIAFYTPSKVTFYL